MQGLLTHTVREIRQREIKVKNLHGKMSIPFYFICGIHYDALIKIFPQFLSNGIYITVHLHNISNIFYVGIQCVQEVVTPQRKY